MPIQIQCQHCSRQLKVKDKYAGKKAKCPDCQELIAIPVDKEGEQKASKSKIIKKKKETFIQEKTPVLHDSSLVDEDDFYTNKKVACMAAATALLFCFAIWSWVHFIMV